MSLYSPDDERRIRSQALVREWTKSGLLDPSQGAVLEAELRVDVRRTNVFLRGGLALFTLLIVAALVELTMEVFDLHDVLPSAITNALSAVVCLGLAHYLVVRQRFYRFGVEEALAVESVVLIAFSAATLIYAPGFSNAWLVTLLVAGAVGGFCIYWRFGYVYAAIGALACVAGVPFLLDVTKAQQHALAAAALAAIFVLARTRRTRYHDEYPGDDYALLQAAALAGLYLTLNLWLTDASFDRAAYGEMSLPITRREALLYAVGGPFYWFTYAMIWALPLAGLYLAIRDKDRPLLAVSLVMMLGTFLTNKPYLGWPRHEWDPILLGVFLMAAAIAVRRWLSSGANGQRAGFTPARILSKQRGAVTILGTASAGFHPDAPSYPESGGSGFDGGRSGGGGASGSY
jgi:nitroreductase